MSIELPDPPEKADVPRDELNQVLADRDWVENDRIFKHFNGQKGYIHRDGRVLRLIGFGRGVIYKSLDDVRRERERYEILMRHSGHVLKDNFPYGEDFPSYVPELINLLATHLQIPREELDGSWESLSKLDKAVVKYGLDKSFEFPVFPALIAYCSEIMIRKTNGRWLMRFDERHRVWEPWVVGANGRRIQLFTSLYDTLMEEPVVSFTSVFAGRG
jgi:hypothetical protein